MIFCLLDLISLIYIQQPLLPPLTIGGINLLALKLTSSLIYIQWPTMVWQPTLQPRLPLQGLSLLDSQPKLNLSLRLPSPHQAGGLLAANRARYVHHYLLKLQANPKVFLLK